MTMTMTNIKNDNVRKLARIVTIDDILPAENADRLENARIGGWNVVVGKDTYRPGDTAIFCEIDSQIPVDDQRFGCPEWMKDQAKDVDGVRRYNVKTARLRGNLSQGILFDLDQFPELEDAEIGDDVTEIIGITKKPDQVTISGDVIGAFPHQFMIKSDSERVQNLNSVWGQIQELNWVVTEKIDGMSVGVINDNGVLRVTHRNNEVTADNHPVFTAITAEEFLAHVPDQWAVQGELFGPKIQKNRLRQDHVQFRIHAVYRQGAPVPKSEWTDWMIDNCVPVRAHYNPEVKNIPETIDEIIDKYDGIKSLINPDALAEGVVLSEWNGTVIPGMDRPNFKVISNAYLMKEK